MPTKSDTVAIEQGCTFDESYALRVKRFCEQFCKASQGRDAKPGLLDWQYESVVKPFYGWRDASGKRRFKKLSLWVPRRNGKSFLMSCLALYHLLADGERGAQVIIVANSIEQARDTIWEEVRRFILDSPELSALRDKKVLNVNVSLRTITYTKTHSVLKVISASPDAKLGKNISAVFYDEVAETHHSQRKIYDAINYSLANREQPVFATLSSAGHDMLGLGKELYDYAKAVATGEKIDTRLLPVIYEADPQDDWTTEATAKKANPSYGTLINDFAECINEAKNNPRLQAEYKCFRLNLWQATAEAWLPSNVIEQCIKPFEETLLYGKRAWIGLDLARGMHDLASYCILVPDGERLALISRCFTPEDSAKQKEQYDKVPYTTWAAQDWLTLTPGDTISLKAVKAALIEDGKRFKVAELGYDPNLGGTIGEELRDECGWLTTIIDQSYPSLSNAVLTLEKYLHERKVFFASPILRWCLGNCQLRMDNHNRVLLDKSGKAGRIDCAQAAVLAVHRYLDKPPDWSRTSPAAVWL